MGNFKLEKYLTLRNVVVLGLLMSFGVTLSEVLRDKQFNFYIFQFATLDFWNGVVPYGEPWFSRYGLDCFVYTPTFNVLFAPIAYLPQPLGEFVWNLMNYGLFAWSICSFPGVDSKAKARTLLYLLPILGPAQLSFQYNVVVAYIFIFALSLLERGKGMWAVLLIMISATTKLYGGAELAILLFYPRFWRNVGWAALFGVLLLALPLIRLSPAELLNFYREWIDAFVERTATRPCQSAFYFRFIDWHAFAPMMRYCQIGIFAVVAALVLWKRALWSNFTFRVGIVAGIMGWCVLFGASTEPHTYLIQLTGYLLWYWCMPHRTKLMKFFYWSVLVVAVLMPVDLICPPSVMLFVFDTLDLNKWLLLGSWCLMLWETFRLPVGDGDGRQTTHHRVGEERGN